MDWCIALGNQGQCPAPQCYTVVATPAPPTQQPTQAPSPQPMPTPTQQPTQAPTQQPTQAPTQQPTQAPAPAECCTGQGGGCAAPCSSGGWCGASESNCVACAGSWCGDSSPTPPAPTPVVNPTPAPPAPAPTPPAPGPSVCCYDPGCTGNCVAGGWCGGSEANCVGCGGDWCSSAAVLVHNSTMKQLRPH